MGKDYETKKKQRRPERLIELEVGATTAENEHDQMSQTASPNY